MAVLPQDEQKLPQNTSGLLANLSSFLKPLIQKPEVFGGMGDFILVVSRDGVVYVRSEGLRPCFRH